MEEGGCGGSDGASSALLNGGGRQRFEVELRPGETTIVSWKKLTKDANKTANNSLPPPVPAPPMPPAVAVNQDLDPLNAPPHLQGEPAENEGNDAAPGSRFGAVIEKIERLYMGKNSSDEEDLNDVVPDDDEYDTEDSFIDDTDLDDYFQVDDSQIKHDGFFVNRGKLERTTVSKDEPTALPNHQRKKRRKDSEKVSGGNDSGQLNTQKVKNKEARKVHAPVDKNPIISSQSKASSTIIPSSSEAIIMAKNIDKQKAVVCQPKDHGSKLKNGSPSSVTPLQKSNDKSSNVKSSSHSGLLLNNSEELNQPLLIREKNVIREQSKAKATRTTQQAAQKSPLMVRKEGSNTKPKSTMLEKAIRDLEKTVVESRPPNMGVADADTCSPAVKKRMPPDIKHKLAKVARLAHANQGKISKELLNRLMSIVGHLIQLRSLRRNIVNMINMGLSAKEEKDARMQQLKKQIEEMVKIRAPMMMSKAMEQQLVGESDDFQESGTKEKEILKRKITMDDALEDEICILYDLFVELLICNQGLDEDAGPQVRKLYADLAELWPQGLMDNHGIREAICRAKDRRKSLHKHKGQEKLKRKKITSPKTNTTIDIEASSVASEYKFSTAVTLAKRKMEVE
ncbi:ubinuclein-1 isoform X1 [Lactuca sativa]|uniref:ubinuclein-1 isoform X1 n=2 Tax=Lactuca sativa TaxID=4236 RepID=UPI000CD969F4|nr:ubinuclein-1 isoform X1 [Lactuca sativa]